jgi:hypothetical protein
MTLKSRLLKVEKGQLSKITYGKRDIWWFFQWLKLAIDLEGKTIGFGKSKRFTGGKRYGSATGIIKHKLKVTAWKQIDLKEIKEMKPILQMLDKERFEYFDKMFFKYKHLFGDFTIRYVKTSKDLIKDDNYFTVQIPISKNRVEIDVELEKLRKIHKVPNIEKKRDINFHRGIKHKEMKRLFDVYKFKQDPDLKNQIIAKRVGYKTGGTYKMKNQNQTAGIRQVQLTYSSAKKLLLNIAKGKFPKNTL